MSSDAFTMSKHVSCPLSWRCSLCCIGSEDSLQEIFESYPVQKSVGNLLFVQLGIVFLKLDELRCV